MGLRAVFIVGKHSTTELHPQSDILKRVYWIGPFLCSQPLSGFKAIRSYMTWLWVSEFLSPLALLLQPYWPLSILEYVKAPFLHEMFSSESSLSTVYKIALWFFLLQYFALMYLCVWVLRFKEHGAGKFAFFVPFPCCAISDKDSEDVACTEEVFNNEFLHELIKNKIS